MCTYYFTTAFLSDYSLYLSETTKFTMKMGKASNTNCIRMKKKRDPVLKRHTDAHMLAYITNRPFFLIGAEKLFSFPFQSSQFLLFLIQSARMHSCILVHAITKWAASARQRSFHCIKLCFALSGAHSRSRFLNRFNFYASLLPSIHQVWPSLYLKKKMRAFLYKRVVSVARCLYAWNSEALSSWEKALNLLRTLI